MPSMHLGMQQKQHTPTCFCALSHDLLAQIVKSHEVIRSLDVHVSAAYTPAPYFLHPYPYTRHSTPHTPACPRNRPLLRLSSMAHDLLTEASWS